jgi:sugar lactone lactonase YvrE
MKPTLAVAVLVVCAAAIAVAQSPSSTFARGSHQQNWQNPGLKAVLAKCRNPPPAFSIPGAANAAAATAAPPEPVLPQPKEIPGVLAAGQSWKVVWSWEGNNVDGPIAADNGAVLFANNDAGNVMKLDPATGLATVAYKDINTAGAVSRQERRAVCRRTGPGRGHRAARTEAEDVRQHVQGRAPRLRGGVVRDLAADARGGSTSPSARGRQRPVLRGCEGVRLPYGQGITFANGVSLSPDEKTLYVTNGAVVLAFDVTADGSLANQREFGKLQGGQGGDGSAVDQQGRVYVATGASVDVFAADGKFVGTIPGPAGVHGTFFGGKDKKTLFGIVFYGTWGTPSARNKIIAIPTIAQGYTGRAK